MYVQDKDDMKNNLDLLQDSLDYCWTWSANHDDEFNDELGGVQDWLDKMKDKLKTI